LRIAVFTKNRTNPAYEAARLGADRAARHLGAETAHYVPDKGDDPDEQSALIDRALTQPPDAFVFAPVHPVRVNAIPEAIAAIRSGEMLATVDFNAMRMAYLATECAVRHLRGEPVPAEIQLPAEIVDRRNCESWDLPYEQRPIPTLEETLARLIQPGKARPGAAPRASRRRGPDPA
jgi:ABC-type sugar transport system substrate-binding protein